MDFHSKLGQINHQDKSKSWLNDRCKLDFKRRGKRDLEPNYHFMKVFWNWYFDSRIRTRKASLQDIFHSNINKWWGETTILGFSPHGQPLEMEQRGISPPIPLHESRQESSQNNFPIPNVLVIIPFKQLLDALDQQHMACIPRFRIGFGYTQKKTGLTRTHCHRMALGLGSLLHHSSLGGNNYPWLIDFAVLWKN